MGGWPRAGKQLRFGRFVRAICVRDRGFLTVKASAFPDRSGPVEKPALCALGLVRCQWSASVKAFRRQVSGDPQVALPAQRTGVAVERGLAFATGGRLGGLLRSAGHANTRFTLPLLTPRDA